MLGRPVSRVNSTRPNSRPLKIVRDPDYQVPQRPELGDQETVFNYGLGFESTSFAADGLEVADFLGAQNSGSPSAKSLETWDVSGLRA